MLLLNNHNKQIQVILSCCLLIQTINKFFDFLLKFIFPAPTATNALQKQEVCVSNVQSFK